jgi:HEAT repeat protein
MRFPNHFQSLALLLHRRLQSDLLAKPFSDAERDILDHQNRRTIERIAAHYLHSPAPEIRLRLCLALANSRDTLQVYHLEKLLIDPSPLVRSGAAFALGQLPCERARDLLVNHISIEDDRETLHQIAIALGQIVSTGISTAY